jgi:hypothetical protein
MVTSLSPCCKKAPKAGVGACHVEVPAYAAKGRFHKGGANRGLRAFGVAKIIALAQTGGKKKVRNLLHSQDRQYPQSCHRIIDLLANGEDADVTCTCVGCELAATWR